MTEKDERKVYTAVDRSNGADGSAEVFFRLNPDGTRTILDFVWWDECAEISPDVWAGLKAKSRQ